jgi:transcriptional antiterminator
MYQIIKVLNNNSVLVTRDDVELILLGKGVGFKKKINQELIISKDYKVYVLKSADHKLNLDVIYQTDAIYLEISSNIIEKARLEYKNFDDNILLPLADHISFSIQRI